MTESRYKKLHEAFMKRLNVLDRQYAPDAPESPEEAAWLEKRMKEVFEAKREDNNASENLPF